MNIKKLSLTLLAIGISVSSWAAEVKHHPNLILTQSGVERMRDSLGQVPLFDQSLAAVKKRSRCRDSAWNRYSHSQRFFRRLHPPAS